MRQPPRRTLWHAGACVLLLFISSCTAAAQKTTPTATPPPPTTTPTPTAVPTTTATVTPNPLPERATYTLEALVDYDGHSVTVEETIAYPNATGGQLTALVLAVVPNLWPDCFTLDAIRIDGLPAREIVLNGQRLEVLLQNTVIEGSIATIQIAYRLALPFIPEVDPNVSRPRIFGYSKIQTNLTNWYPFVVPFRDGNWVLHDPWYYGEHLVYEAADYTVGLRFADPATAPVVAASGAPVSGAESNRFTLQAGRAFAISASREFQVSTEQLGEVTASSYTFPFFQGQGQAALRASTQALQLYAERFGPYPHKTLAIVMGDFNDGMEFSAFFFLPKDFYNLYSANAPHNYLTSVAAHETAHQWWFEQVANDQALQPWVDEALATYAERLYYETYLPEDLASWWSYRVDFFRPQGFVDMPVYAFQGFRPYTDAVYFRGAHFLEDLRLRIGDEAFFGFLQDYLSQERGRIATALEFFSILTSHTTADYSDLVRQYFQNLY